MTLTKDAITNSVSNMADLPKASRVREILDQEKRGKLQGFLGFGSILRAGFSPNEESDGLPLDKIRLCPDEGLIAANIIRIIKIYMIQESFGNP